MFKRIACFVGVCFLFYQAISQVNKFGIPFIRNYTKEEFKAAEQNWAVIQDNRGVLYVGNNYDGVLEYDGKEWRSIKVKNSHVRSLALDDKGKIYVGGTAEFGYLEPNINGDLVYVSLSEKLDSIHHTNSDIYKTHYYKKSVYFNSTDKLYKYTGDSLIWCKELEQGFFFSFIVHNHFYIGHYYKGMYELIGDSLVFVKGSDFFIGKSIFVMLPFKDKVLVGTHLKGLFVFDPETGEVTRDEIKQEVHDIIVNSQLYDGFCVKRNVYVLGTLQKGCIIVNAKGELEYILNEETGLQNQIITSLYFNDREDLFSHPLWMTLSVGLANSDFLNPVKRFGKESGINGGINDVIRYKGELYIATDVGVFFLTSGPDGLTKFQPVEEMTYQSWSFFDFEPGNESRFLLVATQAGIYEINKYKKTISIEDRLLNRYEGKMRARKIIQSSIDPSLIYVGHSAGYVKIRYRNGKWLFIEKISIVRQIKNVYEDVNGDLWLNTAVDGIIKISEKDGDPEVTIFDEKKGLPNKVNLVFFVFNNRRIVGTTEGFYVYESKIDTFIEYKGFGRDYKGVEIYGHGEDTKGIQWFTLHRDNKWEIDLVTPEQDEECVVYNTVLKILPDNFAEAFYFDKDNTAWIAVSDELFSFKADSTWLQNVKKNLQNMNVDSTNFHCLIRSVKIADDSIIFNGAYYNIDESTEITGVSLQQPDNLKYELEYKNNSVTFEFASPYFVQEERTTYSYMLEGFDKEWSRWSGETKAVYTNLNEGDYIFKVLAKNVYDMKSTIASYEFTILPPWYRTIIAYIVYIIAGVSLVFFIVKFYTRRLKMENERLEAIVTERTVEVVKQKDEIEKQRDKIAAQNKDITDSIHYASRIQRALLPSERLLNKNFPDHFVLFRPRDIVSGDFYWMTQTNSKSFIVAADCTGHGVPGAFMSMLGISFLNEIVNKSGVQQPDKILNDLRMHVVDALKQEGKIGEQKDGMDIAFLVIDKKNKKLEFSGANNSAYWIRPLTDDERKEMKKGDVELPRGIERNENYELQTIYADKMPIGISLKIDDPFTNYEIELKEGYTFYIFSDGFVDQFGGEKGKKFMSKSFKNLLLDIQNQPMKKQGELLNEAIEEWMRIGGTSQVDDMLVIGIKIDKLL